MAAILSRPQCVNSVMQRPRQHLCKHVLSILYFPVCVLHIPYCLQVVDSIVVCLIVDVNVSITSFSSYLTLISGPFLPANVRRLYSIVYHFTCHFYCHDDVIKWKHFPPYWPFVRGIHRSTVNSPHKGQ